MSEIRKKRRLEKLPPTLNSFLVLGYAGELRGDSLRRHSDIHRLVNSQWFITTNETTIEIDPNSIVAVYPNSGVVARNKDAVAFYNPGHLTEHSAETSALIREHQRLWRVVLNGVPIESLAELETEATKYTANDQAARMWAYHVWDYIHFHEPEEHIDRWIDIEPTATGLVEFHRLSEQSPNPISIAAIAESDKPISSLILTSVVGALLRGGFSDHFQYTDNGELVINPENPPTLDQSYEILRRTLEVKKTGHALENYSSWTLGMLGDNMERQFGELFDPSEVMEQTGKSYNTYITCVNVYKGMWANRRENLTFTHHKEVFYAKIEDVDKDWVLDTSSRLSLTVAEQRKLLSYIRVYGSEAMRENPPDTAGEMLDRVETRSVNKNFLFFLPTENKWFSYRGPFEHIPNGASPILNADTKTKMAQDGTAESLQAWNPPGIELPYIRGHAAANRNAEAATQTVEEEDLGASLLAEIEDHLESTQEEPALNEAGRALTELLAQYPDPPVRVGNSQEDHEVLLAALGETINPPPRRERPPINAGAFDAEPEDPAIYTTAREQISF